MNNKTISVVLEGRGPTKIRPNDHIATGGEGSAYRLNDTVVKLYTDPKKMVKDDMVGKIELLSKFDHQSIIAPQGLVTDTKGQPLGYYMPYAKGEPLSRVFTNDFRARSGFDNKKATILASKMRETVAYAHDMKALMIDANELNWLVDLIAAPLPYAIDVDAWAIDKWQAKVIMPSIRDWQAKSFNEMTDWFAWGIVTFQIYAGIHPYKGSLQGFKRGDLQGRMQAGASVFDPRIRLNGAVRDFNSIPAGLLQWYEAVFENGERSKPPVVFGTVEKPKAAKTLRKIISSSGSLTYKKLYSLPNDEVLNIFPCGVALFKSGKLVDINSQRVIFKDAAPDSEVVRVENGWLVASEQNDFKFINATSFECTTLIFASGGMKILRYENRLFQITRSGLSEVSVTRIGRPAITVGKTWGAMTSSTQWFDGLGVMDSIGATYLIMPFGDKSCAHVRCKELDGMRIMNAKAGNRFVAIVAADKVGQLHKLELWLDKNYDKFSFYTKKVDTAELNMAILEKGVCATIIDDGELVVFVPANGNVTKTQDSNISADMRLQSDGRRVLMYQQDAIWQLKTT